LKLLLDEQFAPDIAIGLRERKHDVVAVCERPDLISSEDETLLALSSAEGRALLTNNVRDFASIATRWAGDGRPHHGLLFVSDSTLGRSRNTIGTYVSALDKFMAEHPVEDALRDQIRWLTAATEEVGRAL
jgi:predicted nuclease of predicted toxin-antitoxin system